MAKRPPARAGRGLLASLLALAFACVDGDPASVRAPLSLSLVPTLTGAGAAVADVTRIRVRVLTEGGNEVGEPSVFNVSPSASQWDVEITVDLQEVGDARVFISVELISGSGGSERVEWSGRIGPLRLSAGTSATQTVTVFPGPLDNLDVTGVSIATPPRSALLEGETVQLQGSLAGGGSGARVVWSSRDASVATVSESGLVTTHFPGNARIVASAGQQSAEVTLLVLAKLERVVLDPATVEVDAPGDIAQFNARVEDPRGAAIPASQVSFSWQIQNTSIAVHEGDGRFRTVDKGSTGVTVTATFSANSITQGPVSANGTLIVKQGIASITVTPPSLSFDRLGQTRSASAVGMDANGNVISGAVFQWSSGDEDVVTVTGSSTAVVRSVGNGTTQVTASADGVSGSADVSVQQAVGSVTVTPSTASVEVAATAQFQAEAKDPGGAAIVDRPFTWSSSDEAVATVDSEGLATGVADGTAQIRATLDDVTGSATLSVGSVLPAGDYIAYQGGGTIRLMHPDGDEALNTGAGGGHPTWSPDGDYLAYVPVDGGGVRVLSPLAALRGEAFATLLGNSSIQYYAPSWSPDGTRVVAYRDFPSGAVSGASAALQGEASITLLDTETGAETRGSTLFPVFDPDWHPDGQHVVVSYEGWRLYIQHPGSTDHDFITFPPSGHSDRFPEFSPDGTQVAFLRMADNGSSAHLMVLDTDLFSGSNERVVAPDAYWTLNAGGLAWSPDGQWIAYACAGGAAGDICKVMKDGDLHTNLTQTPAVGEYDPAWATVGAARPPAGGGGRRE